jgi:hypothetical protein
MPKQDLVERLVADGLLYREDSRLRTTQRWQGAMARAAVHLRDSNWQTEDLREPIAYALIDIYGDTLDNATIVDAVAVLLPLELAELPPLRAR